MNAIRLHRMTHPPPSPFFPPWPPWLTSCAPCLCFSTVSSLSHQTTLPLRSPSPPPSEGGFLPTFHFMLTPHLSKPPSTLLLSKLPSHPGRASFPAPFSGLAEPGPSPVSHNKSSTPFAPLAPCPPPSLMNLSVGHWRACLGASPRRHTPLGHRTQPCHSMQPNKNAVLWAWKMLKQERTQQNRKQCNN